MNLGLVVVLCGMWWGYPDARGGQIISRCGVGEPLRTVTGDWGFRGHGDIQFLIFVSLCVSFTLV